MKPLHRLLPDSVLGLLACPVPLLCSVLIKFVEARLSLLSGLSSGIGPDFVRGRAKYGTGASLFGAAVDTEALVVLVRVALSDIDGITKLVRTECAEERRECRGISGISATPVSTRVIGDSGAEGSAGFTAGG